MWWTELKEIYNILQLQFWIEDSVMNKAFTNTEEAKENTNDKQCYLKKRDQKDVVSVPCALDSTPS